MGVEAVARSRDDHGSDGGATQTTALPDLVESFVFKPERARGNQPGTTSRRWRGAPDLRFLAGPEETTKPKPPSMDEAGHAYHAALLKVLDALHKVTAAALGLDEDFFAPFYAPPAKCSLRLAYYPPLSTQQTSSAVRYGAHTDYTGYTILCQDDNDVGALDAGGLQVLAQVGAVGGGHAATERLRREHRGLVRGLD